MRSAGSLQITKVCTPPFDNNCYLLRCTETGDTLLVDAAGDAPLLLELVGDGKLVGIVETHGHWDHVHRAPVGAGVARARLVGPQDGRDLRLKREDRKVATLVGESGERGPVVDELELSGVVVVVRP